MHTALHIFRATINIKKSLQQHHQPANHHTFFTPIIILIIIVLSHTRNPSFSTQQATLQYDYHTCIQSTTRR